MPEIDSAGWFDEHRRKPTTKPIVVREAIHVSLRDHDIAGDFVEVWIRNGVPEDSKRALHLARVRWLPLPPLIEPEALAAETVIELPPRADEEQSQDADMT